MHKQIVSDTVKFMKTIQGNAIDWLGGSALRGGIKGHLSEKVTFELESNLSKWNN